MGIVKMLRKFTANGTFVPQDAAGNDMCILFMKYGRCRFKTKCKKSHWVPPLPGIIIYWYHNSDIQCQSQSSD